MSTTENLLSDFTPIVAGETTQTIDLTKPTSLRILPFVGELTFSLKLPQQNTLKGLCFHQNAHTYITDVTQIPQSTYLAIFKNATHYTALLCLSHADLKVELSSNQTDINLKVNSGSSRKANHIRSGFLSLSDSSLESLLKKILKRGLEETGKIGKMHDEKVPLPKEFEGLGWDSGTHPSHDSILFSIRRLKEEGFPVSYLVIGKGWQQTEKGTLFSFDADRSFFPYGLKGTVEALHQEGVKKVGIRHPILGYQNGIHPRLAALYGFPPDVKGRYFPGYDLGKTFQFFYDYYDYLKEQGIQFVQVGDQQGPVDYARSGIDTTLLYHHLQVSIQGAASLHFHTAQINTECLSGENLFYWNLSRIAETTLTHTFWFRYLMQPNFGSLAIENRVSAILQALSGSSLLIKELKDPQLLKKMLLSSGVVLKADEPLTLCEDSIFTNPLQDLTLCKTYTRKGGVGILGLFHFSPKKRTLSATISPKDIPNLKGERFALFSNTHGFLGVLDKEATYTVHLKPERCDIFTLSPIVEGIAVIGSPNYFLTPGPVASFTLEKESLHITCLEKVPLLIYCERKVFDVHCDTKSIRWAYNPQRHLLSIQEDAQYPMAPCHYTIRFE